MQRWEESEKRREEERRSEKRKIKEDHSRERVRRKKMQAREKAHQVWSTFGSWDVESARRCGAKHISKSNAQKTTCSRHFWQLWCGQSARQCGAKHISKSKVLKTAGLGPLLDLQISLRMASARDCAPCQKWTKHEDFVAVSIPTSTTLHSTTTTTTITTTLQYANHITLHDTTLHSATLHLIPVVPHKEVAEVSKIGNL